MLQALEQCKVNTLWIQEEEDLEDWETKPEQVEELMIGDTEYEVSQLYETVAYVDANDLVRDLAQRS